jgi:flagellar basal-body rod modification protein FlgD
MISDPIVAPQTQSSPSTASQKISSDFETFLKMLTAQIENQDPLNPIDSSDYSTQLATFSGVEQQVLTNDLLRSISGALVGSDLTAVSHWVGKDIEVPENFSYSDTSVDIRFDMPKQATQGILSIYDAQGQTVAQFSVATSDKSVTWNGEMSDGRMAPAGPYQARLQPYYNDTELAVQPGYTFQPVTQVRLDNGTAHLVTASGQAYVPSQVTALRAPNMP